MSGTNPKRCALCHRFQWAFVVPVCAMPGKLASLRGALTWQDMPAVCRHSEPDSAVGGPGSTAARAGNALKPPRGAQHHAALSTLSLLSVMPELKPTQKPGRPGKPARLRKSDLASRRGRWHILAGQGPRDCQQSDGLTRSSRARKQGVGQAAREPSPLR